MTVAFAFAILSPNQCYKIFLALISILFGKTWRQQKVRRAPTFAIKIRQGLKSLPASNTLNNLANIKKVL
jgi:hypothetical protein